MDRISKPCRRLALVVVIATAFACAAAGSAGASPPLWVVNPEGSIVSFDVATGHQVGAAIPLGGLPAGLAITPDGSRVYAGSRNGRDVTVIDTAAHAPLTTIGLPGPARQIAASPDSSTVYVTSEESDEKMTAIATATDSARSLDVGPSPGAVAFTPDGKYAYVGIGPNDVQVVETATGNTVGEPIEVMLVPRTIVVTPDGSTIYAIADDGWVSVINTSLRQVTKEFRVQLSASGAAISPDGKRLYIVDGLEKSVAVVDTATNEEVGEPIPVPGILGEIAISPDGKTAYVAAAQTIEEIDLATDEVTGTIEESGVTSQFLLFAPDQSPIAAFTPPSPGLGDSATFDGSASTDPDGLISSYAWSFGDGATAIGPSAVHAYDQSGTYAATLNVVDDEGCGADEKFTGRAAYCSGTVSAVTHPVTVPAPPTTSMPSPPAPPVQPAGAACTTTKLGVGALSDDRKNGTARLKVRLPSAGSVLLFGKKVHAVTRKSSAAGTMTLTIHARVELNKELKRTHAADVPVRITFTPSSGCGAKTVQRSLTLRRSPQGRRR
jgi:DNA-binding beta-propeller fold protein YncE